MNLGKKNWILRLVDKIIKNSYIFQLASIVFVEDDRRRKVKLFIQVE